MSPVSPSLAPPSQESVEARAREQAEKDLGERQLIGGENLSWMEAKVDFLEITQSLAWNLGTD